MKQSSNDDVHPYTKGYIFWNNNRFWRNSGLYSERVKRDLDAWVDAMQKNEKSLTKVDQSITHSKKHHK